MHSIMIFTKKISIKNKSRIKINVGVVKQPLTFRKRYLSYGLQVACCTSHLIAITTVEKAISVPCHDSHVFVCHDLTVTDTSHHSGSISESPSESKSR